MRKVGRTFGPRNREKAPGELSFYKSSRPLCFSFVPRLSTETALRSVSGGIVAPYLRGSRAGERAEYRVREPRPGLLLVILLCIRRRETRANDGRTNSTRVTIGTGRAHDVTLSIRCTFIVQRSC